MSETPSAQRQSDLDQAVLPRGFGHGLIRMAGRDPGENHRSATPLELLFDLAFVVAFSQASGQLAHLVAEGRWAPGLLAFAFAMFATCWAWINFAWFASAYDTDDWFFRITTMVQMIGVIILALGLPAVFHSINAGGPLDNAVVVGGYVVMRVAMVAQWLRAARQDPSRRQTALGYVAFIGIAQLGWVAVAFMELSLAAVTIVIPLLFLVELGGPAIAERKFGGTPWHPHHIAERYSLLTIIALGEGVIGTVVSVSAVVEKQGWSVEAALVVLAGVGLTFGMWWNYFVLPSGAILARFRNRSWVWGYGHMVIFASIAATGAGLHVAAYVLEGESEIGVVAAVAAVAIPVLGFCLGLFLLYSFLVHEIDRLHIALFAGTLAVIALALVLAAGGATVGLCLFVVTLAPAVVVVGFETVGHKHQAEVLGRALAEAPPR